MADMWYVHGSSVARVTLSHSVPCCLLAPAIISTHDDDDQYPPPCDGLGSGVCVHPRHRWGENMSHWGVAHWVGVECSDAGLQEVLRDVRPGFCQGEQVHPALRC